MHTTYNRKEGAGDDSKKSCAKRTRFAVRFFVPEGLRYQPVKPCANITAHTDNIAVTYRIHNDT
jgi:hypothetical protein